MDMIKTGRFLAELRKEHSLTQEQLGEQLGVTNKTVSRWETGTYMPPVEMLQLLSVKYGVTINEILSGERLREDNFKEKAEENLRSALEDSSFSRKERIDYFKKKWKKDHAFELTAEMIAIITAMICGFVLGKSEIVYISLTAAFVWCICSNNRMMAYTEGKVFGTAGNPDKKAERKPQ